MDTPDDMTFLRQYAQLNSDEYNDRAYVEAVATGDMDLVGAVHPICFVPEAVGEAILVQHSARDLFIEHATTEIHTGDTFIAGCPVCESWDEFPLAGGPE